MTESKQAHLVANNISKRFAGLQAVGGDDGLSFTIERGSFVGLIGPNGAGKSTTFNLLSGVLTSDTGTVTYNDYRAAPDAPPSDSAHDIAHGTNPGTAHDITNAAADTIAELGIGRTFQTPRAFDSLSLLDNVVIGATSPGEKLRHTFGRGWRNHEAASVKAATEILVRVGLKDRIGDRVGDLSGGELRMLEVARQLLRQPAMLLLDEPTAGVHPQLQERLAELFAQLHRDGMTLVVVEHNLHFLLALADHVMVLTHGEMLTQGRPDEMRSDPVVISAYLGEEHAA